MNSTHLHVLITHLPIFGSILGSFVLVYGMAAKSSQTRLAAFYLLIIAAIGGGIAYYTGEAAEETVEHIEGIVKSAVEEHEESGKIALISVITIGVLSLAGIYLTIKKSPLSKLVTIIILLCSLLCFGITMRTGYLGGLIRHTEISSEKK